jgi:hypothetical protein
MKARLSALTALSEEQSGTIQSLRAELAAGNEKLARQAAYFMEEMRRLGSGTMPASGPARRSASQAAEAAKRPLAERINDPRVARLVRQEGEEAQAADASAAAAGATPEPRRVSGFLKALDAASAEARVEHAPATDPAVEQPAGTEIKRTRKARLLDRITGLDKNSA